MTTTGKGTFTVYRLGTSGRAHLFKDCSFVASRVREVTVHHGCEWGDDRSHLASLFSPSFADWYKKVWLTGSEDEPLKWRGVRYQVLVCSHCCTRAYNKGLIEKPPEHPWDRWHRKRRHYCGAHR